jgi:hypothetical protein
MHLLAYNLKNKYVIFFAAIFKKLGVNHAALIVFKKIEARCHVQAFAKKLSFPRFPKSPSHSIQVRLQNPGVISAANRDCRQADQATLTEIGEGRTTEVGH